MRKVRFSGLLPTKERKIVIRSGLKSVTVPEKNWARGKGSATEDFWGAWASVAVVLKAASRAKHVSVSHMTEVTYVAQSVGDVWIPSYKTVFG